MLTSRQVKILKILERGNSFTKINDIAQELGVSERTIYSEINVLSKNGYQFESKRGSGIKLTFKNERTPLHILKIQNKTTDERRIEIIEKLLFENKTITYKSLSEEYFVSQSSIKNDLRYIDSLIFKNIDWKLISNHDGTRLGNISTEKKIKVLFNFNQFVMDYIQDDSYNKSSDRIDILGNFYSVDVIKVCKNIFYSLIRTNSISIPEVYVESLLSIFIAFLNELCLGRHIEGKISLLDIKQHAMYISNAVTLLHKASLRLNFSYKNSDVAFLSQMLLNYRFETPTLENIDDQLIKRIIENVSDALSIDLTKDAHLFDQLKVHVPAMIYRLKLQTQKKIHSQIK